MAGDYIVWNLSFRSVNYWTRVAADINWRGCVSSGVFVYREFCQQELHGIRS